MCGVSMVVGVHVGGQGWLEEGEGEVREVTTFAEYGIVHGRVVARQQSAMSVRSRVK